MIVNSAFSNKLRIPEQISEKQQIHTRIKYQNSSRKASKSLSPNSLGDLRTVRNRDQSRSNRTKFQTNRVTIRKQSSQTDLVGAETKLSQPQQIPTLLHNLNRSQHAGTSHDTHIINRSQHNLNNTRSTISISLNNRYHNLTESHDEHRETRIEGPQEFGSLLET